MSEADLLQIADLNLAEFHRETIRVLRGDIAEQGGMLMFASSVPDPTPGILNGAIRLTKTLPPRQALISATRFFTGLGHGFTLIIRTGDNDLERAAIDVGLQLTHQEPAMVLTELGSGEPLPEGCEIRRVTDPVTMLDFKAVATGGYARTDDDVRAAQLVLARKDALIGINRAGFVAYRDGDPAATAMTQVSHGAAFIGWVGTVPAHRKRGLASAVTRAAIEAGFEMGAHIASLQSSAMAYSLYRRLGFVEVGRYREYTAAPDQFLPK